MNCFYHPDKPAVGICKSCSKGLCIDCAADLDHGIACKGKHEQQVEDIKVIVEGNARAYKAAPKTSKTAPLFSFLMGSVFALFGYFKGGGFYNMSFMLGCIFIAFAIYNFVRSFELYPANKEDN